MPCNGILRTSTKKNDILCTASKLFSEHGFWDTSIQDISKATGVADGTIFYHFKSKEELFLAVLTKFKDELVGALKKHLKGEEFADGMAMLEGLVVLYLSQTHKMEERFLLLHRHHYYQIAENNPQYWQQLEELYSSLIALFQQAIERGQQDGSIGPVHAKNQATLIFTLVDGLVRMDTYRLYKTEPLHDELLASCRRMLQTTITS